MADEMKATPRNKTLASLSDAAKWLQENALEKQFGYRNPVTEGLSDLVGFPALQRTLERASYGEPLTTIGKANVPLLHEDTADAAMLVAPLAKPALKAAKATGKFAGKGALEMIDRGMMGEGPLRNFVPQNQFVIKPTGGNWINNSVEKALKRLKSEDRLINPSLLEGFEQSAKDPTDPLRERAIRRLQEHQNEIALNNYVDRNLTNYIKKQMATPDDPVRKLAEEGITHMPENEINYANQWIPEELGLKRMNAGFPSTGIGKSNAAKGWESITDDYIDVGTASQHTRPLTESETRRGIRSTVDDNPWLTKVPPETAVYYPDFRSAGVTDTMSRDLGFDHIMDVLREDVASGRIRPEQLNKVSMEQAVRRTYEYDQELAAKMNASRAAAREGLPTYKDYPEGYKWIELNKPGSFAQESEAMGHSVRGYEPPQGHPDWTEGSGGSGSSGYGHGGWEAIKSGKAKVYSLVDPKGAPHATVEVSLNHPQWSKVENAFGKEIASELFTEFKTINPNYGGTTAEIANMFNQFLATKGLDPVDYGYSISQIKGKQNRAPKEDYLPYVQDFVKSGKWSDVGDFHNTGLVKIDPSSDLAQKIKASGKEPAPYVSQDELTQLLMEHRDPSKGMKRGGKVSISTSPDTMRLELNSRKLAEGGPVANYNTIPDVSDGGSIIQGQPFKRGGKVKLTSNPDVMRLAVQNQKFGKGGVAKKIAGEVADFLGLGAKSATLAKELSVEEKAVLEKWGQKQAQEAERSKKVEKMAKESASKSPEDQVKPAKASTGRRVATPPDFYRKMAEQQGEEAVLKAARAGKHLKPDTSGGYVGGPRTVDSPQALGKMRRELDQDFADSVEAVKVADPERLGTWYDRAKSGMAQMTEPYQLPRTLEQHGVYSAGVSPESELTFALKHLNSRVYGEPKTAYRGAGMRTLDRAVAADEPAEMGFKIGEYADKNDPRLPNNGLFGVNDFRRAQGMGYTDPQGNPWKAGVSDTMHPFMDLETALQVDRANKNALGGRSDWYGPHIQELPWVYGKAQDLYKRGSSKAGRYGGDQLEGIKLALQDANKTAIDYAYKHAGSATHEAIPGASTGHVPSMITAPLEERTAYGNIGRWDRPSPEAALSEFPEVGAGNRDAIYSALGYRQLPTIEASGAYLPEGASKYEMQPVKIARPLLDFPTGGEGLIAQDTKQLMDFAERFRALNDAQEAFGYNLPNTMGSVGNKTSAVLDTRKLNPNKNLDPATGVQPNTEQMGALTAALEDTGYGVAPTSRGATIFPFDPKATPKDMADLLKSKSKKLQSAYPSEMEQSLNSSGYGPGVGMYTPEGFTATEPFSGRATMGVLKEASFLPQSTVQNLSESEYVRQAIKEKIRRDAALPDARADIQETRKFFSEADWAKAVQLIREGMLPAAALSALGYSAQSMAGETDR
jgi:hypothetical protein